MSESEFLQLRLSGGRFSEPGMECPLAQDLLEIGELIVRVAKARYFAENPDRTRVPKGFMDDYAIKIVGFQKGSSVLQFECLPKNGQQKLSGMGSAIPPELVNARDYIYDVIERNEVGDYFEIDQNIEAMVKYLKKISGQLFENEYCDYTVKTKKSPARLTKNSASQLDTTIKLPEDTQENVNLRGAIYELNLEKMTFEFRSLEGRKIIGKVSETHFQKIIDAFNSYTSNGKVLIVGAGTHRRDEPIASFDTISSITELNPLDVANQLSRFRDMKDGWYDGEGKAPAISDLEWLSEHYDKFVPNDIMLPNIFPTLEGGIEMEWAHKNNAISFEIDLETHQGRWFWFDHNSDDEKERTLQLDDEESWKWLVSEILSKTVD